MALSIPKLPPDIRATIQIDADDVSGMLQRLTRFLSSFTPHFYRKEQRTLSRRYVEGLLSDLHRKSAEPIATLHELPRRPLQRFVGAGKWSDARVREVLHRQVNALIGEEDGILILDGSAFPKKGEHSVGVARQWCGRLGKVENCQVGVFVAYSGGGSTMLLDADLYLPQEWTRRRALLREAHVPEEVKFRNKLKIAEAQLALVAPRVRHGWVVGDDEFGRPAWFRRRLDKRGERYVLEVPLNTSIRDLEARPPRTPAGKPGPAFKVVPFPTIDKWLQKHGFKSCKRVTVRNGEQGPKEVDVLIRRVRTMNRFKHGRCELMIITRDVDQPTEIKAFLSNADSRTPSEILTRVAGARHQIEEAFEVCKDDLGMDHYEVRSWVGWHHHMTMTLLTLWFVIREQRRLGEKNNGPDSQLNSPASAEPAA